MNVADLRPPVERKAAFDLYVLQRIPEDTGCYCLCNAAGDVLYMGRAVSLRRRLVQHFDGEKRHAHTEYGRVSMVFWRACTRDKLSALERGWIEHYSLAEGALPPLNAVYGQL